MMEDLDSLLHTGMEISAVYEELTKTLPNDHLDFANVRLTIHWSPSMFTLGGRRVWGWCQHVSPL